MACTLAIIKGLEAEVERLKSAVHELEETVSRIEEERNERGRKIYRLRVVIDAQEAVIDWHEDAVDVLPHDDSEGPADLLKLREALAAAKEKTGK